MYRDAEQDCDQSAGTCSSHFSCIIDAFMAWYLWLAKPQRRPCRQRCQMRSVAAAAMGPLWARSRRRHHLQPSSQTLVQTRILRVHDPSQLCDRPLLSEQWLDGRGQSAGATCKCFPIKVRASKQRGVGRSCDGLVNKPSLEAVPFGASVPQQQVLGGRRRRLELMILSAAPWGASCQHQPPPLPPRLPLCRGLAPRSGWAFT